MKCYEHNEIDALGTCKRCHRGICKESSNQIGEFIYCNECVVGGRNKFKKVVLIVLILSGISLIGMLAPLIISYLR